MPINNRIAHFHDEMTAWRRDLHENPELGFEERRTSDIVAAKLKEWGIEVHRGLAGTGVVGSLKLGTSNRAIGIRADMDALPMSEANGFDHRSKIDGKMHACGHDGHTTMLLGAAKYLSETRNFDGTVHFIFQPAEEGGGGGRVMVEEGLFDLFPVDAVYGLHNDTTLPVGEISVVSGPVQAASDVFRIHITGKGGHAAKPHFCIDPVVVGSHIVVAMQSIAARRVNPLDSAVISITQFHAGTASNIIPHSGWLDGTVRTLLPEVRDDVERLLTQIAETTAMAFGAEARVEYHRNYPVTANHEAQTERAAIAAAKVLGADKVIRERVPSMGGEDFAFMLEARPGCYVKLGQAGADKGKIPVHHPNYDFNDDILPLGASLWASLVEQELPRG
jgi:hippurate hydrolase